LGFLLAHNLASPCLGHEPKVRVATQMILGRKEPRGGGGNPYFFGVVFFFVGLGGFEGHFYL